MITALDPKLVTYVPPEELPLDEVVMTRRQERASFLGELFFWVSAVLFVLGLANCLVYIFGLDANGVSGLIWLTLAVCAAIASPVQVTSEEKYEKQLLHFYQEVPQGKVLSRHISNGNYTVLIEGNNRLNKPRTYTVSVNAGDWYDGVYAKDKYVEIPKTSTD